MVNKTQNYGLYKPNEDDFFSVDHISKNAEITDEELKRLNDDKADKNQLEYKVDKIEGKGLSSNDFTNDEKAKLAAVNENAQVNSNRIINLEENKVNKVQGKQLSTNDYSNEDKEKLKDIQEGAQVNRPISDLIDLDDSSTCASSKAVKSNRDKIAVLSEDIEKLKTNSSHDDIDESIAYISLEILDLKRALHERNLVSFINKTGRGYYDTFENTEGVDLARSTVDFTSERVDFVNDYNVLNMKTQIFDKRFNNFDIVLNLSTVPVFETSKDTLNDNKISGYGNINVNDELLFDKRRLKVKKMLLNNNKLKSEKFKFENKGYQVLLDKNYIYGIGPNNSNQIVRYDIDNNSVPSVIIRDDHSLYFEVSNGYIYYSNSEGVYRCRINGKDNIKLTSDKTTFIKVCGGKMVYQTHYYNLVSCNIDGSDYKTINGDFKGSFALNEQYLFIGEENRRKIYRCNLDGSDLILVIDEEYKAFCVNDEHLYYCDGQDKLYRKDLDGSNKICLYEKPIHDIYVTNEHCYFYERYNKAWNRMNLDGSEKKEIFNTYGQSERLHCVNEDNVVVFDQVIVYPEKELTCDANITLLANQRIPRIDFKASVNNQNLNIKSIDEEAKKYFLNGPVEEQKKVDLTIEGRGKIESLVYTI